MTHGEVAGMVNGTERNTVYYVAEFKTFRCTSFSGWFLLLELQLACQ